MTNEPENLVLKQLASLREVVEKGFATLGERVDSLDKKVGGMATTLVGVQRDVRTLQATVETLGAAVDDHTHRLDQIEKHLGLNAERH